MKKKNARIVTTLSTLAIALVVIIFLVLLYRNGVSKKPNTQIEPTQPPSALQNLSEESAMQEQEQFTKIEDKVKSLLVEKNKWNPEKFTIFLTYGNSPYTVASIQSEDPTIPEGDVLLKMNGEDSYSIVYDPTTKDPCSKLASDERVPPQVAEKCNHD
jgi:hypothetical protein